MYVVYWEIPGAGGGNHYAETLSEARAVYASIVRGYPDAYVAILRESGAKVAEHNA